MNPTPSDLEFRPPKADDPSSPEAQISSSSQQDVTPTLAAETQEENPSVAPFSLSDQPSSDDKFGSRPYVQAIADFLMNKGTQPPLTLSVEGYWGSGKSSFMKQLQVEVENKGARTVWFNAWRYDKEESMLAAFAVALTGELEGIRVVPNDLSPIRSFRRSASAGPASPSICCRNWLSYSAWSS